MKKIIAVILAFFFIQSTSAQSVVDWNSADSILPLNKRIEAGNFIILDKYPSIAGRCTNVGKETEEIKLWDLETGDSKSIYKIKCKDYLGYQEGEEMVSISNLITTHDRSKIIIYVSYSEKYTLKEVSKIWSWNPVFTTPTTPATFQLICYSIPDKKIIWETKRIEEMPYSHYTVSGIHRNFTTSFDDKYIYIVGEEKVTVFSMDTGQIVEDMNFMFPKSLKIAGNSMLFCFSNSGRYIAYFHEASYMNFNLYRGTTINVWDDVEKKIVYKPYVKGRGVRRIAFTPDEQAILAVSNDGILRRVSLPDKQIQTQKIENQEEDFKWEVYNGFYVSSSQQNLLYTKYRESKIWLFPQMQQIFRAKTEFGTLSNDGKYLVLVKGGYLFLLNTDDWSIKWQVLLE